MGCAASNNAVDVADVTSGQEVPSFSNPLGLSPAAVVPDAVVVTSDTHCHPFSQEERERCANSTSEGSTTKKTVADKVAQARLRAAASRRGASPRCRCRYHSGSGSSAAASSASASSSTTSCRQAHPQRRYLPLGLADAVDGSTDSVQLPGSAQKTTAPPSPAIVSDEPAAANAEVHLQHRTSSSRAEGTSMASFECPSQFAAESEEASSLTTQSAAVVEECRPASASLADASVLLPMASRPTPNGHTPCAAADDEAALLQHYLGNAGILSMDEMMIVTAEKKKTAREASH